MNDDQIVRLTKKQIKYLDFLASECRPRSFDGVTEKMLEPLVRFGLLEADPGNTKRPLLCQWWRLTDKGRQVQRSLSVK